MSLYTGCAVKTGRYSSQNESDWHQHLSRHWARVRYVGDKERWRDFVVSQFFGGTYDRISLEMKPAGRGFLEQAIGRYRAAIDEKPEGHDIPFFVVQDFGCQKWWYVPPSGTSYLVTPPEFGLYSVDTPLGYLRKANREYFSLDDKGEGGECGEAKKAGFSIRPLRSICPLEWKVW